MDRAVYYTRVSTQEEIQLKALESQERESIEVIKKNGWLLVEAYKEMKIAKMIQFENMNPPRTSRDKGFRHIPVWSEAFIFLCLAIAVQE